MNRTGLSLAIALTLAGLVTFVAYQLTSLEGTQKVLLSSRVIQVGEPLSRLNTQWQDKKLTEMPADVITESTDMGILQGRVLGRTIPVNSAIRLSDLTKKILPPESHLPSKLPAGTHAMLFDIPQDFEQRSLLRAGDTVDILLTRSLPKKAMEWVQNGDSQQMISEVLLHNVKVVGIKSVGEASSAIGENNQASSTEEKERSLFPMKAQFEHKGSNQSAVRSQVILEVTTQEAQTIELGKAAGKLTILISSAHDPANLKDSNPYTLTEEIGYTKNSDIEHYTVVKGSNVQTIEIKRHE